MADGDLAAWEWGPADAPTVLLVHGWEGRGSQLGALVAPLTTSGFRVVTFDAPGHGDSGGTRASLFQFADSIRRAAETFGPLHAIVTHSMGGASAIWASRSGPLARRVVLIAPPLDLRDFTRTLAGILGLGDEVVSHVHARLRRRFGVPIEEVRSDRVASTLSGPMLVVHDESDREVPIACGEAIAAAWPGAELVRTHGLGHQRVLRDPATLGLIVRFVAQSAPEATKGQPISAGVA